MCAALLTCSVSCKSCRQGQQPAAHVDKTDGDVTVRPAGQQDAKPTGAKAPLFVEDIVSTGANAHATVGFVGGNAVELGPNSSLVVRRMGGTETEFGAVLLSGTMRAQSAGTGALLSIGTPYGIVQMGNKVTVMDISVDRGVTIAVGEVQFDNNGVRRTVGAGRQITVAGLDVPVGQMEVRGLDVKVQHAPEAPPADVVLKPITFVLLSKPKTAEVQQAGQKAWKPAPKRVSLKGGDKLRVKKAGAGTRVQFGDDAALTVKGDSQVDFASAQAGPSRSEAGYALRNGGLQVQLRHQDDKEVEHALEVAGAQVKVRPTLREANVEATSTAKGGQVIVRFGEIVIGDAPPIEAGTVVDIVDGKVVGTRALTGNKVDVRAKSNAVVYFDKKVPAVNFLWSDAATAKPTKLELASDKEFKQLVAAERVSRGSLILDQLPPGKYFWRLDGDNASRGALQFMQESASDCASCQRSNAIEDTGEKTVVYFQQSLPAIVLRWKEVEGAASYSLKVFSDGEFDKPLAEEKTKELKKAFREGKFPEGKYYWLVSALDDADRELAAGHMNALQIAYDNAITSLVIRSPKNNLSVSSSKITATGEAETGARLSINGKRADVDDKGRFSEPINLHAGVNQIVFRATGADGIERFYLRDVTRRQ